MGFDLLALAILIAFAGLGALRGTVAGLVSATSLLLAYGAGVVAALRSGPGIAAGLGIPLWVGAPLAGSLAFGAVFLLLAGLGLWVRRWDRRRVGQSGRTARDRAGGALCGALRGGLVVLLIGVLALWLDAARALAGRAPGEPSTSPLRRATQAAVELGVSSALRESPGSALAANLLARPSESFGRLQAVLAHPHFIALTEDRAFWSYVEHGALDAALNRRAFLQISHDTALRRDLAALGLVETTAAEDPVAFRAATRSVLAEVGPRLQRLRSDPELLALAEDPEIVRLLESGEVVGLMRNPRFAKLVARALDTPDAG